MPTQVLDHPLAGHLLRGLRDKETQHQEFRRLSKILTTLLVLQATTGLKRKATTVETPVGMADVNVLDQSLAVIPILRAGLGMLDPVLELFPDVKVGYIGLERNEGTAIARSYYSKLPHLGGCFTLCVDPMLATGGSASQAVSLIKQHKPERIVMVSVVSAPEGVQALLKNHPDVLIVTAAIDQGLNEKKYIVPGLGDFGDRLYGTYP